MRNFLTVIKSAQGTTWHTTVSASGFTEAIQRAFKRIVEHNNNPVIKAYGPAAFITCPINILAVIDTEARLDISNYQALGRPIVWQYGEPGKGGIVNETM